MLCNLFPSLAFIKPQPDNLFFGSLHHRQLRIYNRKLLLQHNHLPGELALQFVQFRGILRQAITRRVAPATLAKLSLVILCERRSSLICSSLCFLALRASGVISVTGTISNLSVICMQFLQNEN